MLLALVLAAAAAGGEVKTAGHSQYVADQVLADSITLDETKICGKDGFVDPAKFAVQLMIQTKMFDELAKQSAGSKLVELDGRDCPSLPDDPATRKNDIGEKSGACNAAIVVQRLLLNVYPGFRPMAEPARRYQVGGDELQVDVDQLSPEQKKRVLAFTQAFISGQGQKFIQCDYVDKPTSSDARILAAGLPPSRSTILRSRPADAAVGDGELSRNTGYANLATTTHAVTTVLKRLQWRQSPGNLIYRAPADSAQAGDPDYAVSQDLYNSDSGFSFDLSHLLGTSDDGAQGQRDNKVKVVGAIGFPVCGLYSGKECHFGGYWHDDKDHPKFRFDLTPYLSWDHESSKKILVGPPEQATKSTDAEIFEYGLVSYLHSDDGNDGCMFPKLLGRPAAHCATYVSARMFQLQDNQHHSRQNALSLRYIPMFKSSRTGLRTWDVCFNSVCGDADRAFRFGVLGDLRADAGDFRRAGNDPKLTDINKDYVRLGYRTGLMSVVTLVPGAPINLWAAYTRLYPQSGYRNKLDEVQTQASMDFGNVSLSFSWRNGRREDTAQRDSTWEFSVGFKPPS